MKKIISLMLVLAIVLSMGVTSVFAAEIGGNWEGGTVVTYNADATATEYFTVTVPAALDPGDSATVTAEGNFPSNKILKVTADASVGLTDGISTKTLGVSFAGIELAGSDTAAVSASKSVTVANWNDEVKAPLFGEWEGTFNYFVEVVEDTTGGDPGTTESTGTEEATLISFYFGFSDYGYPNCQAEEGMTWEEFVNSDYNTLSLEISGEYIILGTAAVATGDGEPVSKSDVIIANQSYVTIV